MSNGTTPALSLTIPADLAVDLAPSDGARRQPMSIAAMILAALLHIAVPVLLFLHWPDLEPTAPPQPIAVALVVAPPPPEAPPPAPAEKEIPPPAYLESGPGERTTALAPADAVAPERASPPPQSETVEEAPAKEPPTTTGEAPSAKPTPAPAESSRAKPKPRKEIARLAPPAPEAAKPQAPILAPPPRHLNITLGDKNESGDPYLNRILALIEAHRIYPRITGQFGLFVEGVAVYAVVLNRGGAIVKVGLVRSSGNRDLDRIGASMIQQSAPLPPLPTNFPDGAQIEVTLPLYPQS